MRCNSSCEQRAASRRGDECSMLTCTDWTSRRLRSRTRGAADFELPLSEVGTRPSRGCPNSRRCDDVRGPSLVLSCSLFGCDAVSEVGLALLALAPLVERWSSVAREFVEPLAAAADDSAHDSASRAINPHGASHLHMWSLALSIGAEAQMSVASDSASKP